MQPSIIDNLAGPPIAPVIPILLNLEPPPSNPRVGQRIANLFQIRQRRPLVGSIHDIIRPRSQRVPPHRFDRRACLDGDDLIRLHRRVWPPIAGQVIRVNVGDWAIIGGSPDSVRDRIHLAPGIELDKDGMSRRRGGSGKKGQELHPGGRETPGDGQD